MVILGNIGQDTQYRANIVPILFANWESYVTSLPPVDSSPAPSNEEKKKIKTSHPIDNSTQSLFVMHPIFMLSAMTVVVTVIYFYNTVAPLEGCTSPLTIATPVTATVTASLPMPITTQKVKDEWVILVFP